MRWASIGFVAATALLQSVSSLPTDTKPKVVKSETLPDGQILDWVVKESQGKLASPPPSAPSSHGEKSAAAFEFPELNGPEGTVPVLRKTGKKHMKKQPPPKSGLTKRQYSGQHWYGSSAEAVNNNGGGAYFSLFNPYVQSSNDFSLIQTAVIKVQGQNAQYGAGYQTVEAGWQKFGGQQPHLFTYFTTCDYQCDGDNEGGYNTDQAGWMQYDKTVYPGYAFTPLSVDGGAQHDILVQYQLYQGNWWLYVNSKAIGYYPGSLFDQGVDASQTLASGSDQINFYGEIAQNENALTTTDMGSGEFASAGKGRAAYIRNIQYYDTSSNPQNYDGSGQLDTSDPKRYTIAPFFNSGTSWGSYLFVGGPGAGGKIGS